MEVESMNNGGRDFMELESGNVARDRSRKFDDSSAALAEKLLQGWTLLNEHCPQCLTPLVRNRQKKVYCAACKQWVLSEAEAAAKALQQRVDRLEVAEQSPTTSTVSTTPSGTCSNQGPPSPGQRGNVKSNGVNLLRSSLANWRSDDERVPEERNPKRLASSDPGSDTTARLVVPLENGTCRPGITAGPFQAPAFDAVHANPASPQSRPGLVLQPALNPVNDILVYRRTLTTLNEKMESIRHLISLSHDVHELRQLFAVLEECIHAIEVTRNLLRSVEGAAPDLRDGGLST